MLKYYVMAYLAVLLTATSQALLKSGVRRTADRPLVWTYANPWSALAYLLFVLATLFSLYAYRALPLKVAATVVPFTYILVGIYSHFILREHMTRRQALGAAVIVLGVIVFNISPH